MANSGSLDLQGATSDKGDPAQIRDDSFYSLCMHVGEVYRSWGANKAATGFANKPESARVGQFMRAWLAAALADLKTRPTVSLPVNSIEAWQEFLETVQSFIETFPPPAPVPRLEVPK